jgi:type IV pilus assembly protein PilY1
VLWEISNTTTDASGTPYAHLGYTYSYPNVARLNNGKWVVLLSTGYFPLPNQTPVDPASSDPAANQTSLYVIDLETGQKLAEISTSSAPQAAPPQTFGLSTPAAYDLNSDFVDDIAVAGDLAGNLWRFDLRDDSNFKVDLIFKAYGTNTGDVGRFPISVMPVGMRDRAANVPMWVFGTGKYLGLCDRTASTPPAGCGPDANTATQAFFGVRDYGNSTEAAAAGVTYPFVPAQMNKWVISQDSNGVRTLAPTLSLGVNRGWEIPLDVQTEPGERNVVTAVPFYSANYVILTTLIPKGDDPCDPGRRGAIMVVDGAFGSPLPASPLGGGAGPTGGGNDVIGQVVNSNAIPIAGIPSVVGSQGGPLLLPGLPQFSIPAPPPHRGSWRELLDLL